MPGKTERTAGSPTAGEPVFLAAGKIRRSHGVKGEAVVEIYTDFPERLAAGTTIWAGEEHAPLFIENQRQHSEGLLMRFRGMHSPEDIRPLQNKILYIDAANCPPLPAGEYYDHELLGCSVVDDSGKLLGRLVDVLHTGANDVFVVTRENGTEILLPVIPSVVMNIDLEQEMIKVHLLEGLLNPESDSER